MCVGMFIQGYILYVCGDVSTGLYTVYVWDVRIGLHTLCVCGSQSTRLQKTTTTTDTTILNSNPNTITTVSTINIIITVPNTNTYTTATTTTTTIITTITTTLTPTTNTITDRQKFRLLTIKVIGFPQNFLFQDK